MQDNGSRQTSAYSYDPFFLGTVEVTRDQVICTPPLSDSEDHQLVLMDYLSEVACESPWDEPDIDERLQPLPLLEAASAYFFESLLEEKQDRDDQQGQARAAAALQDGPYTGALHAVSIKFLAGSSARFCEVDVVAIRNGDTWRTAEGVPLSDLDRVALVQAVLHDMDTRKPAWEG